MKVTYCSDVLSTESDIVVFVRRNGKLSYVCYDDAGGRRFFKSLINSLCSHFGRDSEFFVLKSEDVNRILEDILNEKSL